MKRYTVRFKKSAEKEFERLSTSLIERMLEHIEALAKNPRPSGCKKLRGSDDDWRIRVGEYRVIYVIDDDRQEIEITRVRHRRDVYE